MGLFKSSNKGKAESGMSLLQGLAILALLGIAAAVALNYFVG